MSVVPGDLGARIERLERHVRRIQVGSLLLFIVAVVAMALAIYGLKPRQLDEIRARRLVLLSEDGLERAWLWIVDGKSTLSLSDGLGRPRVVLSAGRDDASLSISGKDLTSKVVLGVFDQNRPHLSLFDKDDTPRASLFLRESDDSTRLVVRGTAGSGGAELDVPNERGASLRLLGRDQKVLWKAP